VQRRPLGGLHRRRHPTGHYRQAIEDAGLHVQRVRPNPYQFLSARARNASAAFGVRSISVLAVKPDR
jgi:hypothetical protein